MQRLSQHKRRHSPALRDSYDLVVLGAGIGGLSAAITAAQAGASVLVIEQHIVPGGCCSSFYRKGYLFDAAVHNIAGAGHYASYGQMLQRLGISFEFIPYPDNGTTLTPDDQLCFPNVLPALKATLQAKFPHEASGISEYLRSFQRLYRYAWRASPKDQDTLASLRHRTFDELLRDHIHDPRCRWWLSSPWPYLAVPPHQLAAIEGILTLGSYLLQGTYYPKGGTQALANAYTDRLEALGGTIALRTTAQQLHLEYGKIKAVTLSQGQSINTRYVIANIAPHSLLDMLPDTGLTQPMRQAVAAGTSSVSAYLTYLGLAPGADLSQLPWGFLFDDYHNQPDGWVFLSKPTSLEPSLAPPGHQIICTMSGTNLPFANRKEAKGHKEQAAQRLLQRLAPYAPDLQDHVEIIETASPATIHRYTHNPQGSAYGWAATTSQSHQRRLPQTTAISNLFLAGHWTQPGSGVPSVTISGIHAATLALF